MDLVERYLQAVKPFLPRRQQEDVIRELSENLHAQIEDREQERGRALSEDELVEMLRAHGHPMLVAGRYRSRQQLIGPALFPVYLVTLKIGLAVAFAVVVISAVIAALMNVDPVQQSVAVLLDFPRRALMVFAWTTLAFAGLDLARSRLEIRGRWDPRRLPAVIAREHRLSRAQSWFGFVFSTGCVVLLLALPNASYVLGPLAPYLTFAPVWSALFALILALTIATAGLHLVDLIHPYWTPSRSIARLVLHALVFAGFALLLRAGEWVVPRPGAVADGVSFERLAAITDTSFEIALVVAGVVNLVAAAAEANRLRARRKAASRPAAAHAARG